MVEEFLNFVEKYDQTDENIKNKISHTMRVRAGMMASSKELNFTDEEVELATTIGLLHDIGRFDQATQSKTYNDYKSFDHAEYGADLLFKDGLIERFGIKKEHYDVIEFAIRQHNKLKLEENKDELAVKMAKLIRDVDKLDILYNFGTLGRYNLKGDDSEISSLVMEDFLNNRSVDRRNAVTNNDKLVADFAFAFDLNYEASLKIAKDRMKVLYERVEYNGKFKEIYEHVIKYLDERID